MFKLTRQGITFSYNNDSLIWYWWWSRPKTKHKLESLVYRKVFSSLKEYWVHVGRASYSEENRVIKAEGFDLESVLKVWAQVYLRSGHFVVLYDINMAARNPSFWRAVPDRLKGEMGKDVVVLRCKSEEEAELLLGSIDTDLAMAMSIRDGQVVAINLDFRKPILEP